MNRREFLRRAALIAAGAVAADQLELLDRLGWTRSLFPGVGNGLWSGAVSAGEPFSMAMFDRILQEAYCKPMIEAFGPLVPLETPLRSRRVPKSLLHPRQETTWGISRTTFPDWSA